MTQLHLSTQSPQTSFLWVDYELSVLWMFRTPTVQRHTWPFHNSSRTITLVRPRFFTSSLFTSNPQSFGDSHSILTAVCWLFADIFPDLQGPRFISGGPLKAAGTSSIRALKVESVCALVVNIGWSDREAFSGGGRGGWVVKPGGKWEVTEALCVSCPQVLKSIEFNWIRLPAVQIRFRLTDLYQLITTDRHKLLMWRLFSPNPLTRCWNLDD